MITESIGLLGLPAKDKVTGIDGVVTSVSFDLFGCVQAVITPKKVKGESLDSYWVDIARLDVGAVRKRVMPVPDFDGKDRAEKTPPSTPRTYDKGPVNKSAVRKI